MRDYRKIQAWQLADDLTVSICKATRDFPTKRLNYLAEKGYEVLMDQITNTFQRLHGLIKAVEKE